MNEPIESGAIVIGGHVQGLGIIRLLGKIGIRCVVVDYVRTNIAKFSKHCYSYHHYPRTALVPFLLELADKYNNWVIFPTNDATILELNNHREKLNTYFKLAIPQQDVINTCLNKIRTYKLAKKINIDFPESFFPEDLEHLNKNPIEYPCIIKPAMMHSFYSKTKKKVFVCNNKNELVKNYKKAIEIIPKNEVIIQKIIHGSSENQFSVGCFCIEGNPMFILSACRSRQHPPDFGKATTFAISMQNTIIEEISTQILKELSYTGICEVEFKYDAVSNVYKLLEINCRTWKWHYIAKEGEQNPVQQFYYFLHGRQVHYSKPKERIYWIHLITDVFTKLVYKKRKLPIEKIDYSIPSSRIYAVYDKKDILPFLFEMLFFIPNVFRR